MKFGITLSSRGILPGLTTGTLHAWDAIGTPARCAEWIRRFRGSGCRGFTFRLATMGDAMTQLRHLTEQALPLIDQ
jgi:hypothetical protein